METESVGDSPALYDLRGVLELYASSHPKNPPAEPTSTDAVERKGWSSTQWRIWFLGADILGVLFWSYVFLKLFVFDVDRALVKAIAPNAEWLLEFRLFFLAAIVAVVAGFFWRLPTLVTVAYVLLFPFVVVFWKIPKFIADRRSWAFAIAVLNVITVGARNFRYYLVSKSLLLVAAVLIFAQSADPILALAAIVAAALLVWSFVRVIADTFRASWFLSVQNSGIARIMNSSWAKALFTVDHKIIDKGTNLTTDEMNGLVVKIQGAAIVNRGLYAWAYRLQQYRQFQLNLLFNGFAYLLLFVQTVFTLGLLNLALLKIDPTQYTYETYPSAIAMFLYAMSSLFLAEGGGVSANGDAAYLLRMFAGLLGYPFLAVFVVNVMFTWRRERDDTTLDDTVISLRAIARSQDADFRAAVRVSVAEACVLLSEIKALFLVDFFTRDLPPGFLDDEPDAP